jgi:hypothetical protein
VPWIVWAFASLVAAVNTFAAEGASNQAYIYFATGLLFILVVLRHARHSKWHALPSWQKSALPILLISPFAAFLLSPGAGIALQVTFSWVTALAFIQTASSGYSRDPVLAWWAETIGCLLLFFANSFLTISWILPLNSAAVSLVCLWSIRRSTI